MSTKKTVSQNRRESNKRCFQAVKPLHPSHPCRGRGTPEEHPPEAEKHPASSHST